MCHGSTCLGYLFLLVLLGFAFLLFFLLRYRKKFDAKNLQYKPDLIYNTISQRAERHGFSKDDLIYGLYQDKTASIRQIVVKDSNGNIIGSVENHIGVRGLDIIIGNESFKVEFPITWQKSALLKNDIGEILISYERLPFSIRKHQFTVPNVGIFWSHSPLLNPLYPIDYTLNGKTVGLTQQISTRPVGCAAVFSSNLSIQIKVFILAISMTGI